MNEEINTKYKTELDLLSNLPTHLTKLLLKEKNKKVDKNNIQDKDRIPTEDVINFILNNSDDFNLNESDLSEYELFLESLKLINNNKPKPLIQIAGVGRLVSEFATESAEVLQHSDKMFYRVATDEIIEITYLNISDKSDNKIEYVGFKKLETSKFITKLEESITPFVYANIPGEKDIDGTPLKEKTPKSISSELAKNTLNSDILKNKLKRIDTIYSIQQPMFYEDKIILPKIGYDPRFKTFIPFDAPQLTDPKMSLSKAKEVLDDILCDFCWKDKIKDKTKAIMGILTPYLRGLYPANNIRTPIMGYLGNQPRLGKECLATLTPAIYDGVVIEDSPISTENKYANHEDELQKKILSAFMCGRKRLHFSNNKGHMDNPILESIATARTHSDRVLGGNTYATFDNDLEFSFSGNTPITFSTDIINRTLFIRLFLAEDNPNNRKFKRPDLTDYVLENRGLMLSVMNAFVRNWDKMDRPDGKVQFTSFPEWARVCGGIMECAGYTISDYYDDEIVAVCGNPETQEMKELFNFLYKKSKKTNLNGVESNKFLTKKEIKEHLLQIGEFDVDGQPKTQEIFTDYDLYDKSDIIKFSLMLKSYYNRVFDGIYMIPDDEHKRSDKIKLKFTKKPKLQTNKTLFDEEEPKKQTDNKPNNLKSAIIKAIEDTKDQTDSNTQYLSFIEDIVDKVAEYGFTDLNLTEDMLKSLNHPEWSESRVNYFKLV